ncbi:putative ABC transporter substrate-binding protein [Frankia canadensis]|uniref:Putative ABC transporter substrate-binding protein n=1 Tax=Frankia canadensis TaxID=1836972 RepID=A0A2I2KRT6_9ACTN|nr:extracellular solute-binding protein [Frankia canadensis]SNQ48375.1 putative ABC transporter substrate-binding protein [Frankia canadensis]SOU55665.1 putative ABC transporter substrate-binding protein [Frankia canadensis]
MSAARRARLALAILLTCLGCAVGVGACSSGTSGDDGAGPITFAAIADFTNGHQIGKAVDRWNAAHPDQHVRYIELSESADEQRSQLVATAQGSGECYDVNSLDVVWTAEFARGHLVVPLDERESHRYGINKDLFVSASWESGRYRNQQWAVPFLANVPLLFYRRDLLGPATKPPASLQEMISQIGSVNHRRAQAGQEPIGGFGGQFAHYEGLTVNALEIVRALGGDLAPRPNQAVSQADAVRTALGLLAAGARPGGWIPQADLAYKEQGTWEAFLHGQLLFMRNWPYAYKLLTAPTSPVADKVGIEPLPWSGVLGGHNLAVSTCSTHRATAWSFVSYLATNLDVQTTMLRDGGYPPVLQAGYQGRQDDFTKAILAALAHAGTRPVSPYYAAVSGTIQDAVSSVLNQARRPADAVDFLAANLPDALHGG